LAQGGTQGAQPVETPLETLLWYWGTTVLLAVLLFFPVSRLIWTMRVRSMERKLRRRTTEAERQGQLRTARILAALIAITFAFLYNRTLVLPG
jgi:hypothetical protein